MATDLMVPGDIYALPSKYGSDEAFDAVSTSGGFLPRLELFGSNKEIVKEGKFPVGTYGLTRGSDNPQDLGKEVDILPIAKRSKALKIGNETFIAKYDVNDPLFQKIRKESDEIGFGSGCIYGPEFLVYISSVRQLATFFFNNPSMRREAPALKAILDERKAATLKIALAKTKKYSWHVPVVVVCSSFDVSGLEDIQDLRDQVEKFNNPKETEVEEAVSGTERAR